MRSQADECKTLAYIPIIIISVHVLIRVTIWVCEILTLFGDFSIGKYTGT